MHRTTHNLQHLIKFRKCLRNDATSAEATLWNSLKSQQLEGRKFRRQHSIKEMIVDFYCPQEKLIIELDGDPHFTDSGLIKDQERDARLRSLGFRVLGYENDLVFTTLEFVLNDIKQHFKHPHHPWL